MSKSHSENSELSKFNWYLYHMMRKKLVLQALVRKCLMWLACLVHHPRHAEIYRSKQNSLIIVFWKKKKKIIIPDNSMTKKQRSAWRSHFKKEVLQFWEQKWKQLSQYHSFFSAFCNSLTHSQLLTEISVLSCLAAMILELQVIYG